LSDASSKQGVTEPSSSVVPVVAEEIHLTKREVTIGEVRVRTTTHVVEELAQADLKQHHVVVTRVPIDRVVDQIPTIRIDDGVTIVPVVEEVLFVEKRLVLKEEMHIRRSVETERVAVPVSLRKQEAVVERVDSQEQDP
jgi:stress response protein YsnF